MAPHSRASGGLRGLLNSRQLNFAMEAHDALSARITEAAGFEAIWASGLSISTVLGFRDCNEMSWTQMVDVVRSIAGSVGCPVLVDGDSGYGDFNNARMLTRNLCAAGAAGICIEDKVFPKRNSFLTTHHELSPIPEFQGKIMACKEARTNPDFVVVARIEALIAGGGMQDALARAEAFAGAGADAIYIHSRSRTIDEIAEFARKWRGSAPLVISPTTYGETSPAVFRELGIRLAIWGNQNLRAAIRAMTDVCARMRADENTSEVEHRIAPLADVFTLMNYGELESAAGRYAREPLATVGHATRP